MASASRSWIGIGLAAVAVSPVLVAIYPGATLLLIVVMAGVLVLRFWEQNTALGLALLAAVVASWAVAGVGHAIYCLVGVILPAVILAEVRKRGFGLSLGLLLTVLPLAATVLIFRRFVTTLYDLFVLTLESAAASPELRGFYSAQQLEMAADYLNWWAAHAAYYFPAVLVMSFLGYLFFGALAGEYIVTRSDTFIKRVAPFTQWKAAEWLIIAVGIAAIMILSGVHTLEVIGWNVLILLIVTFSIFGLSLLEFYMRKARLPVGVRILVYLALFITQVVAGVLLPLAALFDAKYDFRKIRAKRFG